MTLRSRWPCWCKCCVQYSIASRHRSICCRQRCNRREPWYPKEATLWTMKTLEPHELKRLSR